MVLCLLEACLILYSVVRWFAKGPSDKLPPSLSGIGMVAPVATMGVMLVDLYAGTGGPMVAWMKPALAACYAVLVVANATTAHMVARYGQGRRREAEEEVTGWQRDGVGSGEVDAGRAGEDARRKEIEMRQKELIHDIKYYLKQIGIYAKGNHVDKIEQILSELQVELAASEERTFCPDYFLNALLTDFYERATRSLVSMDVFVEPGFHIERVKDSDVGVVMGNLLDNALEAARPHPQGFVDVKLYMQNGGAFAVIRIENNYVGGMDVIEDSATKKEPRDGIHGLGLKIVNQVVEKYGGHVHRDCSDDSYVTAVILPTKTGS